MTLDQWRANQFHHAELAQFLSSPAGIAFLSVLNSTVPMTPRNEISPVFAATELGRINQHLTVIRLIEAMSRQPEPNAEELVADFSTPAGPELEPEKKKK